MRLSLLGTTRLLSRSGSNRNGTIIDAGLPLQKSFEAVARKWLATIAHGVRDITHNKKLKRFETHVFPIIGNTPLTEIKSPDIYALLKPLITLKKLETAHRVHSEISAAYWCGYATA